jgi:hypothetical protein
MAEDKKDTPETKQQTSYASAALGMLGNIVVSTGKIALGVGKMVFNTVDALYDPKSNFNKWANDTRPINKPAKPNLSGLPKSTKTSEPKLIKLTPEDRARLDSITKSLRQTNATAPLQKSSMPNKAAKPIERKGFGR